jgi:hypothetical protein
MKLKWPWDGSGFEHHERIKAIEEADTNIVETEKEALQRDIGQLKNVNRHLLARAVADGRIEPQVAEMIQTLESTREEAGGGPDSVVPG